MCSPIRSRTRWIPRSISGRLPGTGRLWPARGNLFLNTKEGPAICCHKEGESHHFTENIFHFVKSPRDGWQKSSFHKNWYSGGTELPGQDSQAMTDLPFSLEELTEHVPESREACGGYWDRLAALVETQASVN